MVKLTWHYGEPPKDMPVTQVYAVVFDKFGRTLLKAENKDGKPVFGLIGGTPENFDANRTATLRREFLEEVNTTLKDPIFLVGYQTVEGYNNLPTFAQIRMVAMIDEIGEKKPDPDNGKTYERILTMPQKAIKYLGWGETAEKPILKALEIAQKEFGLVLTEVEDEWV